MRRNGRKNLIVLDDSIGMSIKRGGRRKYASFDDRQRDNFLKIFIGFVVPVLVVVAVWGFVSVAAEIMQPDVNSALNNQNSGDQELIFDDSDSLTILLIKTSDDKKTAQQFLLVRFQPSEKHAYVGSFDPNTITQGVTLAQRFENGGAAECAAALSTLTGCENIHTASMTYNNLKKFVTKIGGITITVPYSINYQSPNNDRNLNVAAGTRLYEGGETARLLNYPDWEGGAAEGRLMHQTVLCTAINEQFYGLDSDELQELFNLFYSNCTSDLTMGIYQRASTGLAYLAGLKDRNLALEADFSPTEKSDGTFVFEGTELKRLQAIFGDRD